MPDIASPWKEIITFLIGGGVIKLLDIGLKYRRERAEMGLVGAQTEDAAVGTLERRVKATVQVIDIYQESADDFAAQIRAMRAENRGLKRKVAEQDQELALLRELKALEGRGRLIEPAP